MAYQNVGTPRFYVSILQWLKSLGQLTVGENNLTQEDARATQRQIEKVLRTNYKVINASMVFGQHSTEDFLSASKDDKRAIIRNFLNLDEIFDIRDKIKEYKSEYSNDKKSIESALRENENQVKDLKKRLENIIDVEIPDVTLESIISSEEIYRKYRTEVALLSSKLFEYNSSREDIDKIIEKGPYSKKDVCYNCKQDYVKEVTDKDIKKYKKELSSLVKISASIESELQHWVAEEYSLREKSIQASKLKESYEKQLNSSEVRREELIGKQLKSISSFEVMKFWEKAFSEQGLIKYIIQNVLSTFNDKCNTYLYLISGGNYYIEFDDQLDEKIYTEKRIIHHEALSGGEKKKINLS